MGWFARLFGREKPAPNVSSLEWNHRVDERPSDDEATAFPSYESAQSNQDLSQLVRAAVEHALAPTMAAVERMRQELNDLALARGSAPAQAGTVANSVMDRADLEWAIENALAYFYRLLRGREEFKVPAAMLGKTPDGNTMLPLDPQQQHILVIMNPLYPHLYTTLLVLPATFTRVDALHRLPNGVQTHALHINTRKAPPGFMEALVIMHRENADNLFLGTLTTMDDATAEHKLQYFRCTGSDIRNPAPDKFPEEMMIYFDSSPSHFILRQSPEGVEDVFSALAMLQRDVEPHTESVLDDSSV